MKTHYNQTLKGKNKENLEWSKREMTTQIQGIFSEFNS